MNRFDPNSYGPACVALLAGDRDCPLGPGEPRVEMRAKLAAADDAALFGERRLVDRAAAAGCRAGLWLLHNFLDESHRISQEIATPSGSYWHGILHRREPDFSNAKYWFDRVGRHPVFAPLAAAARECAAVHLAKSADRAAAFLATQTEWNPHAFVDLCAAVHRGRSPSERLCRDIARIEWELLFDDCYRAAQPSAPVAT